jgi:hypothetical protein
LYFLSFSCFVNSNSMAQTTPALSFDIWQTVKINKDLFLCLINKVLYHEDIWGNEGIAPPFLTSAVDGRLRPKHVVRRGNKSENSCIEDWIHCVLLKTYKCDRMLKYNKYKNLGTRWRWVISFTPLPLYPEERVPGTPLDRRLGEPQSRSGRRGEEKSLAFAVNRTPAAQTVVGHYTVWAIPTPC